MSGGYVAQQMFNWMMLTLDALRVNLSKSVPTRRDSVFNSGRQTLFVDEFDVIRVRGDVLPLDDAWHLRSSMSSRHTLAHELGHQAHQGTSVSNAPRGSVRSVGEG